MYPVLAKVRYDETGHVLGFNHPDTFVGANLVATAPMDASSCLSPLWHVALAEFAADSDSIMFSVSKHRARTCLTEPFASDGLPLT